jgi:hypothetical protein
MTLGQRIPRPRTSSPRCPISLAHHRGFLDDIHETLERYPTKGAFRRFHNLSGLLPAQVAFPSPPENGGLLGPLEATIVDISPGGVCMRVEMTEETLKAMRQIQEGLFVEIDVAPSELLRFTLFGRVAWSWVPTMTEDDTVGSLGVDIKGVAEEDQSFIGKVRKALFREATVEVDRTSRVIKTRSARAIEEGEALGPSSDEPEADQDER